MLTAASLLVAAALQLQGLPAFANGHYVERLADGGSACGDASARWFELDVRTPPNSPSGVDGNAGSLVIALGAAPVDYQLTYALMVDGRVTLDDGTYTLRTSFLTSANGDAELISATASDGGPPIHLVLTDHEPRTHGALANGVDLEPFEHCPADTD